MDDITDSVGVSVVLERLLVQLEELQRRLALVRARVEGWGE